MPHQGSLAGAMPIATLTHEHLEQPITLMPYAGDDEAVLFCRVYLGAEPVKLNTLSRRTGDRLQSRRSRL
jgi:hypothetical protein